MSNYLWVKTKKRIELMEKVAEMPEVGKKPMSDILEMALDEFVKKHSKSKNPQTQIPIFNNESVVAIPNLYEILDNPQMWKKFYNLINKKEYKLLDMAIMQLKNTHDKALKRFD